MKELVSLPYGRELFLAGNDIASLNPLADSTYLRILDVADNEVSDISMLKEFPYLRDLVLSNNKITDLQPLVDNPGMSKGDTLDVTGNPLDLSPDSVVAKQIEQLHARGVAVTAD